MLVIEGGMIHIDISNRKKLTKWLIENKDQLQGIDFADDINSFDGYHLTAEEGINSTDSDVDSCI